MIIEDGQVWIKTWVAIFSFIGLMVVHGAVAITYLHTQFATKDYVKTRDAFTVDMMRSKDDGLEKRMDEVVVELKEQRVILNEIHSGMRINRRHR